ncbi:MAG: dak phosphatase [Paenibacillus sp.]|nr:dak phosphatase [Paenibacillus sp.]
MKTDGWGSFFLSKRFKTLDGLEFSNMIYKGAEFLHANAGNVNALNVFPVPDGDTGTNMNMTLTSGVEELKKKTSPHIGKSAEALSKGLLMGARGNSGVILSQLFRGFAKAVQEHETIDPMLFAQALQQGVDTVYKAILKPVEGTILTVAREAAKHGVASARRSGDITTLMREVLSKAQETLDKTPEQLPVLKQVGVVDAGGQGLVHIYEGFFAALSGELPAAGAAAQPSASAAPPAGELTKHAHAQAHMATEDIEFGYCTEFMIRLQHGQAASEPFNETEFRSELATHGDSVLVVADDEIVKVHLHAEHPGNVLTYAQKYGDLIKIKIDNMREQHSHIVHDQAAPVQAMAPAPAMAKKEEKSTAHKKRYGFVAVAAGDGLAAIFSNLGVDVVLAGGQTMNPSTEDIVDAVEAVPADTVFVLPNNSNIVMAARQAGELLDRRVIVLPTKTIQQGMSAMLAFQANATPERNAEAMEKAAAGVQSGQITFAVRDTVIDDVAIREGDYLALHNNKIVASAPELSVVCEKLFDSLMAGGGEMVTILTGADASEDAII